LWGTAKKTVPVTIITSWDNKKYTVYSNASGEFTAMVKTPSAGGPYQITFSDGEKLVLKDVLIGEVWLCSGQSNMEIPVKGYLNQPIFNSNDLLLDAENYPIRLFRVKRAASAKPLANADATWEKSTAESVKEFSAVGYQFAKILQQQLHVPVGMIESNWGGTNIISWMDKASLADFPDYKVPDENDTKAKASAPTMLFNAMINPLLNYRIKGALWYQGEANRNKPFEYDALMANMVSEWRKLWKVGEFPFYYVQIAPFKYPAGKELVPFLQEAQYKAMAKIPNSGMAVSADAGSPATIHPPDKTSIAKRLAYWALGNTYGKKGLAYKSPTFKSVTFKSDTAELKFNDAPSGFYSNGDAVGFEVAGSDKIFHPAKAVFTSTGIRVISPEVKNPVAVRYAFTDWVQANVYGTDGLPLTPFRTDDWMPAEAKK
jgi:sialate O-acetylesterase